VYLGDDATYQARGCIKPVMVVLSDPWIGKNTWKIDVPNDWIGVGSGNYTVNKVRSATGVEMQLSCTNSNGERLWLILGQYPEDLDESNKPRSGRGWYRSPFVAGKTLALRWYSQGCARPDSCRT
jgi:hypothetical protein